MSNKRIKKKRLLEIMLAECLAREHLLLSAVTEQNGKIAVDNDARSPLVHELAHYKHYMHIEHHAKVNDITYAESKQRFNEKLLEFLKSKWYNIGEDVSGYAQEHLDKHIGRLLSTNEIISEANTLDLLSNNSKGKSIINFLEK
ncbi:TPA: hypothetical protein U2B98_002134 [Streptococcus suis]|nr:hypothetical protein [Streptococcus suis]HEM6089409.1 hypothetical protein [Streptococcus suis]HEM6113147.1 hypothetical protein [Streptococcus suis]HEM6266488.1 hypothetical protein [Streptococcus suis]HEM6290313.1 hypothetical protein [Streptococcus suis]